MIISKCYNCGNNQHTFYTKENGVSLVKCSGCGLLYVRDRPSDDQISEAAKQGTHRGIKELDVTGHFRNYKIPKYLDVLEDIFDSNFGNAQTWLDVGCGHGEFIMAIQKYCKGSIKVCGSEPNIKKQESARKRGLNVGYFELESHSQKYDIISLLNVYSHLPDPPKFLEALKKLLIPGGEIVLQTGDAAHFSAKDQVAPLNLPDHLSFASEKIVVDILERLDFEILKIKKYPSLDRNLSSFAREIIKLFLPKYKSRIKYFALKKYSQNNMYIRARLIM